MAQESRVNSATFLSLRSQPFLVRADDTVDPDILRPSEDMMHIVDHAGQERESWRPGVLTRMRISAMTGAAQLCVFEQWCDPGSAHPPFACGGRDPDCTWGRAEVWVGDGIASDSRTVGDRSGRPPARVPQSVLAWPPGRLVTMKRVSVPCSPASTRAMMRSTRLQLAAPSKNSVKRRTLPCRGAAAKRALAFASRPTMCRRRVEVVATPRMKSMPLVRHQSITSGPQ